jgi:hypothetical protein
MVGLLVVLLFAASCGWRLVGTGSSLDPGIKIIAVPVFQNRTQVDEVEQLLTEAVINEFIRRGRHKVVAEPTEADAVLEGTITQVRVRVTELDDAGRAVRAEGFILIDLIFRDRRKDEIAWEKQGFLFSQEFDIPETSSEYVEQEVLALEDLSQEFASSVVSSILEGF